jgi:hypothetical protein
VCYVIRKTISKLEHVILTILLFVGAENIDKHISRFLVYQMDCRSELAIAQKNQSWQLLTKIEGGDACTMESYSFHRSLLKLFLEMI